MTVLALLLLGLSVVGGVLQVRRRAWAVLPVGASVVAVAGGLVDAGQVRSVLDTLAPPLAFLLLAVPMAVLLDGLGAFASVARRLPARRLTLGLWVLGAVTVALLNLDAAVVLFTPIAIRSARRAGVDPLGMALQPFLLAALASSLLPVSNLTNLIIEERDPRGAGAFLVHLGPSTLLMLVVGYVLWRRWWRPGVLGSAMGGEVRPGSSAGPAVTALRTGTTSSVPAALASTDGSDPGAVGDDRAAFVTAGVVGLYLLVGFTLGGALGAPAWTVVAVAVSGLAVRARSVPVGAIPWTSALVVAALAVVAVAAAGQVDLGPVIGEGEGVLGTLRIVGVGALGANLTNNLPAFLAGLPALPGGDLARWSWLLGVNAGPTLVVSGSLAGMLWVEIVRHHDVAVSWRDVARAGLQVGLPSLLVGAVVLALVG